MTQERTKQAAKRLSKMVEGAKDARVTPTGGIYRDAATVIASKAAQDQLKVLRRSFPTGRKPAQNAG